MQKLEINKKYITNQEITSMSVLLIVGRKCTLATSLAVPWWVTMSMPTGQTSNLSHPGAELNYRRHLANMIKPKLRCEADSVGQTWRKRASKTQDLLDQTSSNFQRCRGIIGGVNACIYFASFPFVVECQRSEWIAPKKSISVAMPIERLGKRGHRPIDHAHPHV